jgi:hypothetical protein
MIVIGTALNFDSRHKTLTMMFWQAQYFCKLGEYWKRVFYAIKDQNV